LFLYFRNAGWSHGREKLGANPDYSKGSFYANPLFDDPPVDEEIKKSNPYAYPPNIWPKESLPELEPAFKVRRSYYISPWYSIN